MIYNIFMISSFILLILILISYYFVNSKEHLISTIPGGQKITYEGDAIRYTCGDTDQVIHNDRPMWASVVVVHKGSTNLTLDNHPV